MTAKEMAQAAVTEGRRIVYVPTLDDVRAQIKPSWRFGWSKCPAKNLIAPWHRMGEVLFVAEADREVAEAWTGN